MSYISYELYHDSHNYGDQKFKEFKKDVNKSNASMRLMSKTKSPSTIYSKCNHVNRNLWNYGYHVPKNIVQPNLYSEIAKGA